MFRLSIIFDLKPCMRTRQFSRKIQKIVLRTYAFYKDIKVVRLRKSDYMCECGFCQRLNRYQECACRSEYDCLALVAKNNGDRRIS